MELQSSNNPNQDEKLVRDAQRDPLKFDKIYQFYAEKIKNYLKPKVNDEFTAEDLTSQTFEKAIKNIKSFKWQGISFSAWLYKIANNNLIDFYRKNKNSVSLDETFQENIKDGAKLPEDNIIENDTNSRIRKLLAELPPREREVVKLKFFDGVNNREIAEKLGLSETNVGTIVHRAMKKLKEVLATESLQ